MKKSDFLNFWHKFEVTPDSEIRFLIGDTKYYVVSYYEVDDILYVLAIDDGESARHINVAHIKHIRLENEQND